MPASSITTYGQFYEVCGAFPEDQWISILAAFTTVVAGSPSPSEVRSNVLAQPNPMHVFAYVTASGQITTIHRFSRMTTRMGQPKTQWDDRNFATDMDWTEMGVRTVELPPSLFNRATPTLVPVLVEEVLQYFANNPQAESMPMLPAAQALPELKQFLSGCAPLCPTS
jgi:hypothetical protein